MKLTVEAAIKIDSGLAALDGYERVAKDGDRERVVREVYKLGGGLRILIGINRRRIEELVMVHNDERMKLIMALAGEGGVEVPKAKEGEFHLRYREMLVSEHEMDLKKIVVDQLRLDENPIPPSVLALLMPILEGVE